MPYAWYGFRPKPNPLPKNVTQWFSEIMPGLIDQTSWQAWFGGVVIVAPDRLSGMRARRDLWRFRYSLNFTFATQCVDPMADSRRLASGFILLASPLPVRGLADLGMTRNTTYLHVAQPLAIHIVVRIMVVNNM